MCNASIIPTSCTFFHTNSTPDFTRKNCDSRIPYKRHFVTNTYTENKTDLRPIAPLRSLGNLPPNTNRNVKCSRLITVPTTTRCRMLLPTAGHSTVYSKRPSACFQLWPLWLLLFVFSCTELTAHSVGSDNRCRLKYIPCSFCFTAEVLTFCSKHQN